MCTHFESHSIVSEVPHNMNAKMLLAFFGTFLVMGMALAEGPVQENMNTLHKDRRLAVVNELMTAQEQISKALWKMYKGVSPPGEGQGGPDGPDCSSESTEGAEENAYMQMKQNKIKEIRDKLHANVYHVAQNFLSMQNSIDSIVKKVDKEVKDSKSEVSYNLYYNKRPQRGSSEEHSGEHGHQRPQSSIHYRASRQLQHVVEPVVKVEEEKEPEEVVKTVDGEEVVQTLPE